MPHQGNSLEHHWMPFTANRQFKADPRLVVRGEGMHYWDHNGTKILDASSGLFCCAAGHGRKEIADAVYRQLLDLDFVPNYQMGHPAAFEVARRLVQWTPGGLNHVFFSNSGSEAIETALKMALAYHRANGEGQRSRFVSRERAYHGVNMGGLALGGMVKNRETFATTLPNVVHMRHTGACGAAFAWGQPIDGADLADDLLRAVETYGGSTIAACFVEPIAGSTGVLVAPVGYLERLREICDAHGILLVFDEVICGFGRLGTAFAAQAFGVTPDLMTVAKAITNGAQPMGAVVCRDEIYETMTNAAPDGAIEFFHGNTYAGHPAASAAALATFDIYEAEDLFARAAALAPYFAERMMGLEGVDGVVGVRGHGLLGAFDLAPAAAGPGIRGPAFQARLFHAGLHVKFTGDTGIVAPPLIAEPTDIDRILEILETEIAKAASP